MIARTAAVGLLALATLAILWPAPLPGTASEAQQPADGRYPSTDIPAATSGEHRPTVSVGKPDPAAVLRPTPRVLGNLAASPSSRRVRGPATLDGRTGGKLTLQNRPQQRWEGQEAADTPKPLRGATGRSQTPSRASGTARAVVDASGRSVTGVASWYCLPGRSPCTVGFPASGLYAAAGPELRRLLGNWRGRTVTVGAGNASVPVRLTDWCACPGGRLVDLYASVWFGLGVPLSAGIVTVEVTW